jgi:hypothetical protein
VAANLVAALAGGRPGSVSEAVGRLSAIQEALPPSDGVAHFNRLYLTVTQAVGAGLGESAYADPAFVERLDVIFAGLYLDALDAHARGAAAIPSAWAPLFDAAGERGIIPLQFAFAGMNAHINRDLPVALVETCRELGVEPRRGGPQHDDFVRVNGQLAEIQERVKASYLTGVLGFLDRVLSRVDDIVAMWNVARARDAAWTNGATLWLLRDDVRLSTEFLATLDRTVGLAGRGLLMPVERVPLPRWLRARRFLRLAARL